MAEKAAAVVSLNVGGKRFQTYQETLFGSEADSKLAQIVLEANSSNEKSQEIFIDRDGQIFQFILHVRYCKMPDVCPPLECKPLGVIVTPKPAPNGKLPRI